MPFYPITVLHRLDTPLGSRYFGQTTSILLPNGKVFINTLGSNICYILEPNEYGSYRGGRIRRIADIPQTNTWGSAFILNSGKMLFTCGEFSVTASTRACQLFDPITETWTLLGDNGLDGHDPLYMTTQGDLYGNSGYHLKDSNMTPSERKNYFVQRSVGNPVLSASPNL